MDIVYKAKSPVRLEDLVRGVAGRGEGGGQFTLFRHETCCVLFLFFFTNFTAKGQQRELHHELCVVRCQSCHKTSPASQPPRSGLSFYHIR